MNNADLSVVTSPDLKRPLLLCNICDYKTFRRFNYERHLNGMHGILEKGIKCCDITFLTNHDAKVHRVTDHKDGYLCQQCPWIFRRASLLNRHTFVHSGIKIFKCGCGYDTSLKYNFTRHQNTCLKSGEHRGIKRKIDESGKQASPIVTKRRKLDTSSSERRATNKSSPASVKTPQLRRSLRKSVKKDESLLDVTKEPKLQKSSAKRESDANVDESKQGSSSSDSKIQPTLQKSSSDLDGSDVVVERKPKPLPIIEKKQRLEDLIGKLRMNLSTNNHDTAVETQ